MAPRYGGARAKPARGAAHARCTSHKVNFGDELVSPEEKTRRVGEVFSSVARRYDVMNDLMSGGLHRLWKDRFVARVKPRAGERILDMAGGTGDIAFRMAERGAQVTVADINADMLAVGEERAKKRGIAGLQLAGRECRGADLRRQQLRCLHDRVRNPERHRHSGRAAGSAPRARSAAAASTAWNSRRSDWPGFAELYDAYSTERHPALGKAIADDEASYRYLVEIIRRFPRPEAFRGDGRRGRLRPRRGRADARRPRHHPQRVEDLTTTRHPSVAAAEMGPDARPPRRAARHRGAIR